MTSRTEVKEFLSNDNGLKLLKTIDFLNPPEVPVSKLSTIKDVSIGLGLPLKETWGLIDWAYKCGLVTFYGGLLSKKRVDLSEIGEKLVDCTTPEEIGVVLNEI